MLLPRSQQSSRQRCSSRCSQRRSRRRFVTSTLCMV